MKLRKTIKNWKQIVMDMRSYLPLEPSHLDSHLQIDFQMVKHKLPIRFITYAFYRSPEMSPCKWEMRPAASVLFFLFSISHVWYVPFTEHICDTFLLTLALCLGSSYSEHTINNAYAFSIYTLKVRFWFLKWH